MCTSQNDYFSQFTKKKKPSKIEDKYSWRHSCMAPCNCSPKNIFLCIVLSLKATVKEKSNIYFFIKWAQNKYILWFCADRRNKSIPYICRRVGTETQSNVFIKECFYFMFSFSQCQQVPKIPILIKKEKLW